MIMRNLPYLGEICGSNVSHDDKVINVIKCTQIKETMNNINTQIFLDSEAC